MIAFNEVSTSGTAADPAWSPATEKG